MFARFGLAAIAARNASWLPTHDSTCGWYISSVASGSGNCRGQASGSAGGAPGGVQLLEPSDSGGGAVLPAQPASATSATSRRTLHCFASADSDATRAAMFWVKATRPVLSAATIAS